MKNVLKSPHSIKLDMREIYAPLANSYFATGLGRRLKYLLERLYFKHAGHKMLITLRGQQAVFHWLTRLALGEVVLSHTGDQTAHVVAGPYEATSLSKGE